MIPRRFGLKDDEPSSLIIVAAEVLERLIDAAGISRSRSKVKTYPNLCSAKSVWKSLMSVFGKLVELDLRPIEMKVKIRTEA